MRRIPGASKPIAVEVELTDKSARRLGEILRAWRRSLANEQFFRVRYLCSPHALPYVSRAAERIGGEWGVDVEPLEHSIGALACHRRPARLALRR